jgi:hypothetical protein
MALRTTVRGLSDPTKIVTPAYRRWMRTHADDPMPEWVVQRIAEQLAKKQRDRRASFSGSSAGACLRAQEFGYLGIAPAVEQLPDVDLICIFNDGKWRHLRWQANLLAANILTEIEVSQSWIPKRSEGSMDGIGVVPDNHPNLDWRGLEFGFELKGVNGFQFAKLVKKELPKDEHLYQVDRYFLTSGVDLFVVLYECKLTQRTHEWVLTRDDIRIKESLEELEDLNHAVDTQTLHPQLRTCAARMGPFWDGCPYAGRGGICETWRDKGKTWL